MFKVGRWRNEKIKVVFMLHFQATQVPLSKSRLMISVVPVDVGQPTVRLGKALVQNGICTWKNPVYETVKFTRDTKTGILQDKFYQFIISTGSSKSNFFGEVFINMADYVEATSPFTLSIPIKSSFAGAILHVIIQNTQGADDIRELQRENEENVTLTAKTPEISLRGQLSNSEFDDGGLNYSTQQGGYNNTMVSSDIDGRESLSNASTLDSLFKQKDSKIEVQQEDVGNQSPYRKNTVTEAQKIEQTQEIDDLYWTSEDEVVNFIESTKGDFPRAREQEPPKTLVEQLQREILALQRKADVTDIELQSLRRQVVKETKRGQELSGQVVKLKEEKEAWRMESEKLRSQQKVNNGASYPQEMGIKTKKSSHSPNEVEEDLNHAKGVNRALRSQLRKTQDSNSELILVVRDLEEKLDKREKELANISKKLQDGKKGGEITDRDSENGLHSDEEVHERTPCIDLKDTVTLQEQIKNLQNELEGHVKEKRQLEEEIEQYGRDYEMAKKDNNDLSSKFNQKQLELIKKERECTHNLRKMEELESQMSRLENVLRKQAEEFSENSATITDLETEVSSLKNELERQAMEFEDELKVMSNDKVELEERALLAEENLRRTKLDNASAAQKLQEEFRELSEELASKFNENEELAIKADAEAGELRGHIAILEEDLQNTTRELELVQHQCATEVEKISSQLREKDIELEQLLHSHKGETAQLSRSHEKLEDKCEALSNENQTLRMEVERLTEENYFFTKQLEETKTLVDETKTALEEIKRNRDEFESKYCSALTEIKQSQEELKGLRNLTKKVDELAGAQSQLENLQTQHNELKTRLSDIKSDNENLRKQVSRHKENIQKKDTEIVHLEKFKDSSSKEISSLKDKVKQLKAVRPVGISSENGNKAEEKKLGTVKKAQQAASLGKPLQNGSSKIAAESRRETGIEKKVTDSRTSDLLSEVALLMEKNRSTEDELKELQEKYSDVSLKFAEVEGERQQLVMTIRNLRNGQRK